ncbi:peptidylprolyl isomerase [Bradyrhizobium sp.]|uniref:peptidylprolyl isomerase n=1 Tax=Bradyrhizobium sp. TaxID=376 RepID=UPI00239800EA|nr:peptidylprolyl isomerase [Bradyrhizobium sp.]MDE2377912.1 peptidylprolyl isomerase [Bradyrhizobium sp.]
MTVLVNGVAVSSLRDESAQFAAVRELLRQRAIAVGVIDSDTRNEGEVSAAIETLLRQEVRTPEPIEAECRRYYEHHRHEFESGELVHARHILFQVAPGVNVGALREHAEQTLNELLGQPERFAAVALELSNCPSALHGGNLGQIGRGDTVPEFERVLFRLESTGILPEVVKTRYGFHLVAVDKRIPGNILPFDVVKERISERLKQGVEAKALRQYVSLLAGQAEIMGIDLGGVDIPLVQ